MQRSGVFVIGSGVLIGLLLVFAVIAFTGNLGSVAAQIGEVADSLTNRGPRGPGEVTAYRCGPDDEESRRIPIGGTYDVATGVVDWDAIRPGGVTGWHGPMPLCHAEPADGDTPATLLWVAKAAVSAPAETTSIINLQWGIPHEAGGTGPPGPKGDKGDPGAGGLTGSISIAPFGIPDRASAIRDYKFAAEDVNATYLTEQGANELEIWFKNFAMHEVDPWTPSADFVLDVNVNATEAASIAIGAGEKQIPVRAVFRKDGAYVGLLNTWLEIGRTEGGGGTGDVTTAQLAAEVKTLNQKITDERVASNNGDVLVVQKIGTATAMQTLLNRPQIDQGANEWIQITADFNLTIAGNNLLFKKGEYWQLAPHGSIPTKLIEKPEGLSQAQEIGFLNIHVTPNRIEYQAAKKDAALQTTIELRVANPELLTGDIWYEGLVDGQPVLARTKWSASTRVLRYVIPAQTARLIGQNPALDVGLNFYNVASGSGAGTIVESLQYSVDLFELPADPEPESLLSVRMGQENLENTTEAQSGLYSSGTTGGFLTIPTGNDAYGTTTTLRWNIGMARHSIPTGVRYNETTGTLSLPPGVWAVEAMAMFTISSLNRRNDAQRVYPELLLREGNIYTYKESSYWRSSLDTDATLSVAGIIFVPSGTKTVEIHARSIADGAGATTLIQNAHFEAVRLGGT